MRRLRILGAVVGLAAIAGGVYWHLTRLDRAVARAGASPCTPDDDLAVLRDHAADPRALAGADKMTAVFLKAESCQAPELQTLDVIYAAQPLTGAEGAGVATTALARCGHEAAKRWGNFSPEELVAGAYTTLNKGRHKSDNDPLIAWIEDRNAAVSPQLLTTVALAVGTSARADGYFERGFPADGAPLTDATVIPPSGDARLVRPVTEALLQFKGHTPRSAAVLPALAKVMRVVDVPGTEELISASLSLRPGEATTEIVTNLFTADDIPRIRAYVEKHEKAALGGTRLLAMLEALGGGADDDVQVMFDSLAQRVATNYLPALASPEDRRRVVNTADTVGRTGARGVRVARKNLTHENAAIREAAMEALFILDPEHFAENIAPAAEALSVTLMQRAIALAGTEYDPDLRLRLASLSLPGMVAGVRKDLAVLPAETLVPNLFGYLARRESFSRAEVGAYRALLRDAKDSADATARVLDEALARAGAPERVYWLTKLLALGHLAEVGGPAQRDVVAKFVADTASYEQASEQYDEDGKTERRTAQVHSFGDLARETLRALDRG